MNAVPHARIHRDPQPASRLAVILASLATIVFTSGASYFTARWLADGTTTRTEQISEINRFLRSTEAFEPLVRTHMTNLLDDRPAEKSKEALIANIQEQHVILDTVRPLIPDDLKPKGDRYAAVLEETGPAVEKADDVLTAGPLMQQANDAVVAKRELAEALRKGAGLSD